MKAMLFASIMAAMPVGSEAAPLSQAAIAVRLYNYAAVPFEQLAAAKSEVEHIFRGAGIAVEWIECRVSGGEGRAPCTEPLLMGHDLMLRLVDRTPTSGERVVVLGESMLDREQGGGVLTTIDVFPVRSIAARTSTSLETLLGRAVAHEIGHLLLGNAEHPRLGLMRALWSHDELRGLKPAHWGFSAREAARMRQTLRAKPRTGH